MMAARRVTDRAERYRAQKNVTCSLCGATKLEVGAAAWIELGRDEEGNVVITAHGPQGVVVLSADSALRLSEALKKCVSSEQVHYMMVKL